MTSPIITKLTEMFREEQFNPKHFQFTDAVEQTEGYFDDDPTISVWGMFMNPNMWTIVDGEDDQSVNMQELIDYANDDGYIDSSWKVADTKDLRVVTIVHSDDVISDHVYVCALTDLACSKLYAAFVNVD